MQTNERVRVCWGAVLVSIYKHLACFTIPVLVVLVCARIYHQTDIFFGSCMTSAIFSSSSLQQLLEFLEEYASLHTLNKEPSTERSV